MEHKEKLISEVSYQYASAWNEIERGNSSYAYTMIDPDIRCTTQIYVPDETISDPWSALDVLYQNLKRGEIPLSDNTKRITINGHPGLLTSGTLNANANLLVILVAPDNEHYVMTAYTDAGDVDMAELKNYLALVGSVATESN